MPASTPCRRCRRVGFVRFETVIKGGTAIRLAYCGSCDHTWRMSASSSAASDPGGPPPARTLLVTPR